MNGRTTVEQQNKISTSAILHFIPWNSNLVSTPCRLVFDASQVTSTGKNLNNLLVKGRNNMNKLVEIATRWQIGEYAFHIDVCKMYNIIKLVEEHWCYQLYLWQKDLDLEQEPKLKVIKTLIYGVKSSGNQAEKGLRETGNLSMDKYPWVNEIIQLDIFVDDWMSGEHSMNLIHETTDNLKVVLSKGGFGLMGFTFFGI